MADSATETVDAGGRSELSFALVAGVYVGAIAGTATATVGRLVGADSGLLALAFFVVAGATTILAATAVSLIDRLAGRLGATGWKWLLVVAPVAGIVAATAAVTLDGNGFVGGTARVVLFGSAGTAFLGLVVASMATNRYVADTLADATVDATWSAPWPSRLRRRVWLLAAATAIAGIVAYAVGRAVEQPVVEVGGLFLLIEGFVLTTVGRGVRYRATDRGLEIRASAVTRRLVPWTTFAGYRTDDDALVLPRTAPWQPSIRCALSAIDDPDAVVVALDAHLERRP